MSEPRNAWSGFTLVELLVVVAIMSLLLAILLPALGRAKELAVSVKCQANVHQLGIAWHTFVMDNKGRLPSAETTGYGKAQELAYAGFNPERWVLSDGNGNTEKAITDGALWDYVTSIPSYRCPADKTVKKWSYAINLLMAGHNGQQWLARYPDGWEDHAFRLSEIEVPASAIVFVEEDGGNINAGSWMVGTEGDEWVDIPAHYHSESANFSYADGHSERYEWRDPRTIEMTGHFVITPANPDLEWVQQRLHPKE